MIEEFVRKLKNHEYISNDLYSNVLQLDQSVIPDFFHIDQYNELVLKKLEKENKDYFNHLYDGIDENIHLDDEQIKAILSDEKYSLIIAGAGTGKTTTMASKVKYLVDKKHVQPERILVMSYTRKATEELEKRIQGDFNIPAHITTFHSLGYEYIREIFYNRKCVIIDRNKRQEIFLNYFKELFKDKDKIEEIFNHFEVVKSKNRFIFSSFFMNHYRDFDTYDEFIDYYVKEKLLEAERFGFSNKIEDWKAKQLLKDENIRSIKGDVVKSAGEEMIANFLFTNGLDYSYEEVYDELMENRSIYRPDFTVDYGGEKIYIEYFGLEDENYLFIKERKEEYHRSHHNKFIELERVPLAEIETVLDMKLKEMNVVYHKREDKEVYEHILRLNPLSQIYPFSNYLYHFIQCRKGSSERNNPQIIQDYIDTLDDFEKEDIQIQSKYLIDFYNYYSSQLYGGECYYFDFDDLLYYSVKYLEKLTIDTTLRFDYIILDEYQDISKIKYELTYKTAKRNDSKVYAVGDDWQSIYAFSGSRIEYIYRFQDFFPGAKILKISKTYRNSQELINYSGAFIMRNASQIKKILLSDKHLDKPIIKKIFPNEKDGEIECLKKTILEIHEKYPEHNILIVGRVNATIDRCFNDEELIDSIGTKVIFKGYEEIDIDAMTMHKSKGLTFDEVIIIGLNQSFPSAKTDIIWFEALYKNKTLEEKIPFAEERRLFYVALTRTKNFVYLLCNEDPSKRSEFISEIDDIIGSYPDNEVI